MSDRLNKNDSWGAWVAQSVGRPTSAQVKILRSVSWSPTSGSVLTAQSLEPVSDSVSPSLSDPPPFMLCLCLKNETLRGAWVAQLVGRPTSAQVMISWSVRAVSWSPASGSVLTAQSLEPVSDSVSPSL